MSFLSSWPFSCDLFSAFAYNWMSSFSSYFLPFVPELGLCIIEFGVNGGKCCISAGAHLGVDHLCGLLLDHGPLFILQPLHILEYFPHDGSIVPFVVLVEPEFVDVDQEAEEG